MQKQLQKRKRYATFMKQLYNAYCYVIMPLMDGHFDKSVTKQLSNK